MSEATLSTQIGDLAEEFGYYTGYGRTYTSWSGWQTASPFVASTKDSQLGDFLSVVKHAQRMVYQPRSADPQSPPHRWSFLTLENTLTTVAGVTDYPLPDDYGGFEGLMTYPSTQNQWVTIRRTGIGEVRRQLQLSAGVTLAPWMFAENPLPCDGTAGQRFSVAFYPTPDQAYVLTYRMQVQLDALTAMKPFPYGGAQHAEMFVAAVLAAAELHINEQQNGPKMQDFQAQLLASIAVDARDHRPEFLGYNGDNSDGNGQWANNVWGDHTWLNYATYNGASMGP